MVTETAGAVPADAELCRVLDLHRAGQWTACAVGDPYASLLCLEEEDPQAIGRRLRARGAATGGLYQSPLGVWVVTEPALVTAALRDERLTLRPPALDGPGGPLPPLERAVPLEEAFLYGERADYERLGEVDAPAEPAGTFRERLRALGPEFDLMADLARPAVTDAAADVLGVPAGDRDRFHGLCEGAAGAADATLCPPSLGAARRLLASVAGLREMFGDRAEDDLARCVLAAVLGTGCAANLLCEALAALLDHPGRWARLRADPAPAGDAVEEALRLAPPLRLRRLFAREEPEWAGGRVPAGAELVLAVAAASRDPDPHPGPDPHPDPHPDPDAFLFTRGTRKRHPPVHADSHDGRLADPQFAVVAPLVRRYASAAIRILAEEVPAIRRSGPVLRRPRAPVTGGTLEYPVRRR
ncbi:hypothetical protein GCM10023085_49270 [Actinomadura viridis]|uniref:P450-derived glycosyltransferase activator n=1 Tax=Actinomadura viridis TaxID=58110 RepID=A0A931DMY3_9ACTN|nr:hypothetical protein [Actinomadura viridis]MBG6090571.1 P450-derived glycosyltransferase activator [Actinomadura viridis]